MPARFYVILRLMEGVNEKQFLGPLYEIHDDPLPFGFKAGDKGAHTSRTIMLLELGMLFASCPDALSREEYAGAALHDNCLEKRTSATRKLTLQRLSELYGLDSEIPLARVMKFFWFEESAGHPLLALLLALARDPLLRATAAPVLQMYAGEELSRQTLTDAVTAAVGDRLNDSTLDKVVRNASSSWTQSGHLEGRVRKIRREVQPGPAVVAYALFLGYCTGRRGSSLFETPWTLVLDRPITGLISLAGEAKRRGWLDMNQAGGIIEISFNRILTDNERRLFGGTH